MVNDNLKCAWQHRISLNGIKAIQNSMENYVEVDNQRKIDDDFSNEQTTISFTFI